MGGAAALHDAIELASLTSLALLRAQNGGAVRRLEVLLSAAPTIGWLLCLALSRVRELDADAAALELTGDPLIARGGAQQVWNVTKSAFRSSRSLHSRMVRCPFCGATQQPRNVSASCLASPIDLILLERRHEEHPTNCLRI